jgi:hypothetical protein
MSIILTLEQKVVEDIIAVIKRLPFQPHFLVHLEEQLESQLAKIETPVVEAAPVDPVAEPVAEPAVEETPAS